MGKTKTDKTTVVDTTAVIVVGEAVETAKPTEKIRKVTINGEVHQRGLTYKKDGVVILADAANNTFHKIAMEIVLKGDECMPLTKIAGNVANNFNNWAARVKGLVKKAGFLVDFSITIEENNEVMELTANVTNRLQLSQPSDVASYVMQTMLGVLAQDNNEGYATGNFVVTPEGKLLGERMQLGTKFAALPPNVQTSLLDAKRKGIKAFVREAKKEALAN